MTAAIVYIGLAVAIFGAYFIGRSLDKQQSNDRATWKTGCIGPRTVFQSVVLGAVLGPAVYFLKGGQENLLVCVGGMMLAPFLVDLLSPTVTIHGNSQPVAFASKLNIAHVAAIVICAIAIGAFVAGSLLANNTTREANVHSTCPR